MLHGDMQGKQFKVWVDRVSASQITSDSWLVKCDKWESFGEISLGHSIVVFVIANRLLDELGSRNEGELVLPLLTRKR